MGEEFSKSHRRWFRFAFSLRALFFLVTLFGIILGWLSWQWRVVRERSAMRSWLESRGAMIVSNATWAQLTVNHGGSTSWPRTVKIRKNLEVIQKLQKDHDSLPRVRQLFGDQYVEGICLSEESTGRAREIGWLFPEASVIPDSVEGPAIGEKIQSILSSRTQFEFEAVPLEDVVDYLKDLHGVEILLDSDALQRVRREGSASVCLKVKNIPLDEALHKLLAPYGLVFTVGHRAVIVTTAP